ncbi:MAG: hypothetical protein IT437_06570 [Phycisphaerales bacterium]|nr:hypothetical protein [Phycisphaerales bacterium]
MPVRPRQSVCRLLAAAACAAGLAAIPGCQIFGFAAAGIENYKRSRPVDVAAEYTGLEGHTFAVVVASDRIIQSDHPGVTDELTKRITERLEKESGAAGRVPAEKCLRYLYDHPSWVAKPRGELARELGVDRLILIELIEYQVSDPGNQYVWNGVAAGNVGVIEAESPDEFAYQKALRVMFPDDSGHGPGDMSQVAVSSVLIARFTDRASWLFYTHKETGELKY